MPNNITRYYFLTLLGLLLSVHLYAQDIQLKGTVLDKELISLPYAHIYTSSQKGTYADIDAKFYLKVSLGDTVDFSSVGYEIATLIITDSAQVQEVTMLLKKKSIVLEDIVVRDYYQANTIIRQPELEKMRVPGVHYAPRSSEAEKYNLGVVGSIFSPAEALYRLGSKKFKEEKRNYEETVIREKENTEYAKAKKSLDEAFDALDEELDEYYYRDFIKYVGLTYQGISTRSTYDLIILIREPLERFRKRLSDEGK